MRDTSLEPILIPPKKKVTFEDERRPSNATVCLGIPPQDVRDRAEKAAAHMKELAELNPDAHLVPVRDFFSCYAQIVNVTDFHEPIDFHAAQVSCEEGMRAGYRYLTLCYTQFVMAHFEALADVLVADIQAIAPWLKVKWDPYPDTEPFHPVLASMLAWGKMLRCAHKVGLPAHIEMRLLGYLKKMLTILGMPSKKFECSTQEHVGFSSKSIYFYCGLFSEVISQKSWGNPKHVEYLLSILNLKDISPSPGVFNTTHTLIKKLEDDMQKLIDLSVQSINIVTELQNPSPELLNLG